MFRRFGKPNEDFFLTDIGKFDLFNSYYSESFLKNDFANLGYLEHIYQYIPTRKNTELQTKLEN